MASLWQNFIGPIAQQGNFGGQFVLGLKFKTDNATDIINLSWYATNSNTADKPTRLDLWDHATGTVVASTSAIAHSGAPGWQPCPLAAVYTTSPGQVLEISGQFLTTTHMGGNSTPPPAVPGLPLVAPGTVQSAFNTYQEPTNASAFYWAVDVNTVASTSTGGSGGTTATPGDVANSLADWFDPTDATQPASQPKLYPDTIIGLNGKISNDGVTWDAKLGPMVTYGTVGNKGISAGVDIVRLQSVANGAAIAALPAPASPASVAALQSDLDAFAAATTANFVRLLNLGTFPSSPWALQDETDWDDAIAWPVAADLYVVSFTSTPPTIPDNGRAGVPVRYRLAWWTPLNGTFAQERRWIDFENVHLVDPAGRMPGVLLQTYLSGSGHIQAWTLNV